jgi:hypothetical protein
MVGVLAVNARFTALRGTSGNCHARALASQFAFTGAKISVQLRNMPYGREFYARDPDGYILGFIQAR